MSRFDFLDLVKNTLRDSNREKVELRKIFPKKTKILKFVKRVNEVIMVPEHRVDLANSIDPGTDYVQRLRQKRSRHHEDTPLVREATAHFHKMSKKEKEYLQQHGMDITKLSVKKEPAHKAKNGKIVRLLGFLRLTLR